MDNHFSERHSVPDSFPVVKGISCMIFRLRRIRFALETGFCKEVSSLKTIHTLPHRSDSLLTGIVNLNGILQLCFSLENFLKIDRSFFLFPDLLPEEKSESHSSYMIAIEKEGNLWIFPVDEIEGVRECFFHDKRTAPEEMKFVKAVFSIESGSDVDQGNDKVILLDGDAVMDELKKAIL